MNGYPAFPQRPYPTSNNGPNMMNMNADGMNFGMVEAQSLDDIVTQNDKVNRRKSMPVYGGGVSMQTIGSPDPRRLSMMDFGETSTSTSDLDGFQFSPQGSMSMEGMMRGPSFSRATTGIQDEKNNPAVDLAINTQFSNGNSSFQNMQTPGSAYASPMHSNMPLDMDMTSPYPTTMSMPLDMSDPALAMMGADMNMFSSAQFEPSMMDSPIAPDFVGAMQPPLADPNTTTLRTTEQFPSRSISSTSDVRSGLPTRANSQEQGSSRSNSRPQNDQQPTPKNYQSQVSAPQDLQQQDAPTEQFAQMKFPWSTPQGGFPSTMRNNPHMSTQFKNAYSSTGFDMLGVLVGLIRHMIQLTW